MRRTLRACALAGVVTALASACSGADRPSAQPAPAAAPGSGTATTSAPVYATACPPWPDMPTGRIAYAQTRRGGTDALYLMKPDGTDRRCLIDTTGPDSHPAWSPDGKWIAFIGGTAEQDDVYVVRADGTRLRQLTRTAEFDEGPVWSPDGTRIGYTAFPTRDGPTSIHLMNRDGSHDAVILRTGGEILWVQLKDWSPDGKTLLYNADAGNGGLWAMRPDGTGRRLLRSGPGDFGTEAVYSPDGRSIAFGAELNGGCIYRSDPQARRLVRLTKNCVPAYVLTWSPDGRWIAWAGGAHGPADAEVMASDGSQRHTIADGGDVAFVAWQPTTTG